MVLPTTPADWEVYIKWYPDEVIALYCGRCRLALTNAPATRSEWRFTPTKLSAMIAAHLQEEHPDAAAPSVNARSRRKGTR